MEAFVILTAEGKFFRVEQNPQRAENFKSSGYRIEPIAMQKTATGYEGENAYGRLVISAGNKQWTSKVQSSKKIDKAKDDEY